jgi:hypothetical protein
MRKAGSTTIFRDLQNFYSKNDDSRFSSVQVQGEEQGRFNVACLAPVFASRALYITNLREPLSRIRSEFFFQGPGGKHRGEQPNTDGVWLPWMADAKNRSRLGGNHSCVFHGGILMDNMYIRALTGKSESHRALKNESDDDCGSCRQNEKGNFRGCLVCGRGGRSPRIKPITPIDLKLAMHVLEQFDLVVILELLGNEHHMRRVREVLHIQDSSFSFGHARSSNKAHQAGSDIPPTALAMLRDENSPDIELYREWKNRAECAIATATTATLTSVATTRRVVARSLADFSETQPHNTKNRRLIVHDTKNRRLAIHDGACGNRSFYTSPPRLSRGSYSHVYLRRMRKAGSTAIMHGLGLLYDKEKPKKIFLQGEEQSTFNLACLQVAMAQSVLLVTHLREPLSRIKSEFYFRGPGSELEGRQGNTERVWMKWIQDSHELKKLHGNHSCGTIACLILFCTFACHHFYQVC